MSFKFNETQMLVLKNFCNISPTMILKSNSFVCVNEPIRTCCGIYEFEDSLDIEQIGIFNMPEFLAYVSAYKNPDIIVSDTYLTIKEGNAKNTYYTMAENLMNNKPLPDYKGKAPTLTYDCEFTFTAEKLNMLLKMSSLSKSDFVFFQNENGKLKVILGNDIEGTSNTWELTIDEDQILKNDLVKTIRVNVSEFRVIATDYTVKIHPSIIWMKNAIGVDYFIGTSVVK